MVAFNSLPDSLFSRSNTFRSNLLLIDIRCHDTGIYVGGFRMKVNILGTDYEIIEQTEQDNPKLVNANGICEIYAKKIVIRKLPLNDPDAYENIGAFRERVIRHEIVHAFLAESGLISNCDYATNEELVDWIAIQFPKIAKAFEEVSNKE